MYGLPRPWYFPLQKSYWLGSGRIETWEWPWSSSARLSVMEEDQACAMEHRRSGTNIRSVYGTSIMTVELWSCSRVRVSYLSVSPRGNPWNRRGTQSLTAGGVHRQTHQGLQDGQQAGSQQAQLKSARKPGCLLLGTQRSWQDHHYVRENCVYVHCYLVLLD